MRAAALVAAFCVAIPIHVQAQAALTGLSEQVVTVGAAKIKLPAGKWDELEAKTLAQTRLNGGSWSNNSMVMRAFAQREVGKVATLFVVQANDIPNPNGWVAPGYCSRTDTFWADQQGGWSQNFTCALTNHFVFDSAPSNGSPVKEAYLQSKTLGQVPRTMIYSEFDFAQGPNQIWIWVGFNPEVAGFAPAVPQWSESAWQRLQLDAEHRAYLEKVVLWTKGYRSHLEEAFR